MPYRLGPGDIAPALALVALGTISGTVVGGRLSDRLPRTAIFVVARSCPGLIAMALSALRRVSLSVLVGGLFHADQLGQPAGGSGIGLGVIARSRGALLGLLSLTNQGGVVVGSTLGGVAIGLGGYSWLAVLTLLGRLGVAALALPFSLARRR